MSKRGIYVMGVLTLVGFPLLATLVQFFFTNYRIMELLHLEDLRSGELILGASIGVIYAFFSLLVLGSELFEQAPDRVERFVKNLNLSFWDALFLSICAGVGEEIFFRSSLQTFIGPFWGSLLFVAVHGYLVPWNWRKSLYGLLVLPLTFILAYGYEYFGLWFSIGVHILYDLVLFEAMRKGD